MFKIEILSGGIVRKKNLSATLRGLKAQQVRSPGQRPGLWTGYPFRALAAKLRDCPCKGLIFQDRGLPLSPAAAHRFSLLPL